MIKLKIHSSVDVITNSSTVIFTYQHSTTQAKELVAEIIKLSDTPDLTPDDVFYFGEFCHEDVYNDYKENYEVDITREGVKNLIDSVLMGEIDKPDWMKEIEESENYYDYYSPDLYLHIKPKDDKYKPLADKLISFLNSPSHEATRDG